MHDPFHLTRMGQKFFEGTVPRFIKSVDRLSDAVTRLAGAAETSCAREERRSSDQLGDQLGYLFHQWPTEMTEQLDGWSAGTWLALLARAIISGTTVSVNRQGEFVKVLRSRYSDNESVWAHIMEEGDL